MNRIDVTRFLESLYPPHLAYDWDNIGLQVGSLNKPLKRVLITLDVTRSVVKEAIEKRIDLLISHHPLIFQPIHNILFDTPRGALIKNLVKHDIALFSMHTNFDRADGGMNDILARKIGIKDAKLLDETYEIGRYGAIEPTTIKELVAMVKEVLELDHVRLIGDETREVSVVGISGGSGQQHIIPAQRKGCDVFLTGDISYHQAIDALQMGFPLVDIGHTAEKVFVEAVFDALKEQFPELDIAKSGIDTNPYQTL